MEEQKKLSNLEKILQSLKEQNREIAKQYRLPKGVFRFKTHEEADKWWEEHKVNRTQK